jgi:hypothetical protein
VIAGRRLPDGVGNSRLLVLGVRRRVAWTDHRQGDSDEEHIVTHVVFLIRWDEVVGSWLSSREEISKGWRWTERDVGFGRAATATFFFFFIIIL